METGGAPLKPWEVARKTQSSLPSTMTQEEKEERQTLTQPTSSYTPYARMSTPYGSPYQTPNYGNNYGGNYGNNYGGNYGSNYGTSYGYPSYGTGMYGSYGNVYSYGRPTPWSTPHLQNMGEVPPNGGGSKSPMWQRFLDGLHKVVNCFGRVTFLVDENTQAFHFFITALLAFLDKAGSLYGEIARFVMKLIGFRRRSKKLPSIPNRPTEKGLDATEIFKTVWKK